MRDDMSFPFCLSEKENWRFVLLQVTLSFVIPPLFYPPNVNPFRCRVFDSGFRSPVSSVTSDLSANHQCVNLLVSILRATCRLLQHDLSLALVFSRIPKRRKARNLRRCRIYDAASTESRSLTQTLITQEPSSGLARSRSNLTLFIKRVTVNRRVLSE